MGSAPPKEVGLVLRSRNSFWKEAGRARAEGTEPPEQGGTAGVPPTPEWRASCEQAPRATRKRAAPRTT